MNPHQTIKRFASIFISLIIFSIFSFTNVYAAFSPYLSYQGKLADGTGSSVSDGTYDMRFRLYTAPTGGTSIFDETLTATTTGGIFSVTVGMSSSTASVDFNQPLYLGITVGTDSEMLPRKILTSSPSAFEADKLDGYDASDLLSNAFSTTSAEHFLAQNQGTSWSTTSANNFIKSTTTDALAEGTNNFYYTLSRFATSLSGTTTDALIEGAQNLYFTLERFASALSGTTTDALTEGSNNLYWTDARFDARLSATTSLPNLTTLLGLINATTTALTVTGGSWMGTTTIKDLNITDDPNYGLKLEYQSGAGSIYSFDSYAGTFKPIELTAQNYSFYVGSSVADRYMYINDSGKVGIGENINPGAQLDVSNSFRVSSSTATVPVSGSGLELYFLPIGESMVMSVDRSSSLYKPINYAGSEQRFFIGSSEKMRIDSTGNLGIGTTSPYARLSVDGQIAGDYLSMVSTTATSSITNLSVDNLRITSLLNCDTIDTDSNGFLMCGTDAGAGGGITSLGAQYSVPLTTSAQTFATSSDSNIQISVVSTGSIHTFSPSWLGTLSISRGGTGLSSITENQILIGGAGNTFSQIATSSLGLPTWNDISNTYFSISDWYSTTTDALVEGSINKYFTNENLAAALSGTTTDAIAPGSNPDRQYYSTTSVAYFASTGAMWSTTTADYYIHSSTTIPKTYTNNTFSLLNIFNGGATSTALTVSGNSWLGTTTITNLAVTNTNLSTLAGLLNVNSTTGTSTFASNLNVQGQLQIGNGSIYLRDNATSTFTGGIALTTTTGCISVNGVCLGSGGGSGDVGTGLTGQLPYYAAGGTVLTATSSLFIAPNGYIGIGNITPQVSLHLGNASPVGLTAFQDSLMISGGLEVAGDSYLGGSIEFSGDSGAISWMDMPVTAVSSVGAEQSYTAKIDDLDILTVFAKSDGVGGVTDSAIGIGTTSPYAKLSVTDDDSILHDVFVIATSTGALFRFDSNGDAYSYSSFTAGGADLAENYFVSDNSRPGEIVSLDSNGLNYVKKASENDKFIIGVISTRPGLKMGGDVKNGTPIALAGRVPVKVSLENGPIQTGDRIALSSVPGVGMKMSSESNQSIGVALESYLSDDGLMEGEIGEIMVFVNLSWSKLDNSISGGKIDSGIWTTDNTTGFIKSVTAQILDMQGQDILKIGSLMSASGSWSISTDGVIKAKTLCLDDICITKDGLRALLINAGIDLTTQNSSPATISTTTDEATTIPEPTDTTPPTITLLGNNPATLSVTIPSTTYSDMGATVTDNKDENLGYTTEVWKEGTKLYDDINSQPLNTSEPTTYEIHYNTIDGAGNTATTVTRTVIINGMTPVVTEPTEEVETETSTTTP